MDSAALDSHPAGSAADRSALQHCRSMRLCSAYVGPAEVGTASMIYCGPLVYMGLPDFRNPAAASALAVRARYAGNPRSLVVAVEVASRGRTRSHSGAAAGTAADCMAGFRTVVAGTEEVAGRTDPAGRGLDSSGAAVGVGSRSNLGLTC